MKYWFIVFNKDSRRGDRNSALLEIELAYDNLFYCWFSDAEFTFSAIHFKWVLLINLNLLWFDRFISPAIFLSGTEEDQLNINNSFSCISDRFLLLVQISVGLIRLKLSEINFLIKIFLFLPIATSEREHGAVLQAASNQQHELLLQGFAWVIERLTYSIFSSVWKFYERFLKMIIEHYQRDQWSRSPTTTYHYKALNNI